MTPVHYDASVGLLLSLAIVLAGAKIGGEAALRFKQPAVLGELMFGIIAGNLDLFGVSFFRQIALDPTIDTLAKLGVIVLLFEVGLGSTVGQMLRVGVSAFVVAVLGVLAPFALGWGASALLLPDQSVYAHIFIGATLCATSVGITARVLQDLGKTNSTEARVILGAAVIDDVLGLIVLAAVTGVITSTGQGERFTIGDAGWIVAKASGFLFGALAAGIVLAPRLFGLASRLRATGVLLATGLAFCFLLAWLSAVAGLAPIVGAFAAGLVLENVHYHSFVERGERGLEELISPIVKFLSPVFFVVMGLKTDLRAFADTSVVVLAAALTTAAIIGKQLCALGVVDKGVSRLTVGIGMIPRGEVGLIFANIGLTLSVGGTRIIDDTLYSAIIAMVFVTTVVTPPLLRWSFARGSHIGNPADC